MDKKNSSKRHSIKNSIPIERLLLFKQEKLIAIKNEIPLLRFEKYETIGTLFESSQSGLTEQIFSDRIRLLLIEVIETLAQLLGLAIELEKTISILIDKIEIDPKIHLIFSSLTTEV